MRGLVLGVLCAALVAAPAQAAMRSAQAFYVDVTALQAKGVGALFSGKIGPLKREGEAAGDYAQAMRRQAIADGRPAPYCPPARNSFGQKELMAGLGAMTREQRERITIGDALVRILGRYYPCR